jgi:putative colanic acid biosynthesis acetyltransferase WcaF
MSDFNPLIPRDVSPWTTKQKVARMIWAMVETTLFRLSFHNWYPWRAMLLRMFGAKIGRNARIRRTVRIEIPWNLHLGDDVIVGDGAILYALGPITIGDRVMISQYVHLCAGSHDHRFRSYPQTRPPIKIGEDCWIAAGAFIGPGVTVGNRTVVGARAGVFKDVPGDVIVGGNPSKVLKPRIFEGKLAGEAVPAGHADEPKP